MSKFRKKYVLRGRRDDVIGCLLHDLRCLPRDKEYVVTLERLAMPVSDAQRGLFWIWMEMLAADIGDTKEEIYERYVKNGPFLNGLGISEISDEDMTEVMNHLQRYFAEWGYNLPSGHDDYYEMLESQQAQRGKTFERY